MFYSLKSDCYFRRYNDIGYIARPIITIEEVVDNVGAIFLECLSYSPRSIADIVDELIDCFDSVSQNELRDDLIKFYSDFVEDGFLNYAEKLDDFKEKGFEYATLKGKMGYSNFKPQIEEASSTMLNNYFIDTPQLLTFHVELTSKCNERCVHCYIPHENKTTEIDYDFMMDVLTQCKEMNVMTLVFSGGEPLLHPHFCDFLKKAKDMDFNVTVLSNLTLLTDEIIDALTYKHACCVNVSLYSMEAAVHDSITTLKGSFEKTKNNILQLIKNNVAVQINLPVMKQNMTTFTGVIEWGQNHKCVVNTDYLMMARSDHSTDNLVNRLSAEDMRTVIKEFMRKDVVAKTSMDNYLKTGDINQYNKNDRICGVGITTLCMVTNGDVFPCAGWQKFTCGNLKQMSLREIWQDSPQVNYLRSIRRRDFKKCINCEDQDYCLMCMSKNSNESQDGDLFKIPPITCDAARIHHEIVNEMIGNGTLGLMD